MKRDVAGTERGYKDLHEHLDELRRLGLLLTIDTWRTSCWRSIFTR